MHTTDFIKRILYVTHRADDTSRNWPEQAWNEFYKEGHLRPGQQLEADQINILHFRLLATEKSHGSKNQLNTPELTPFIQAILSLVELHCCPQNDGWQSKLAQKLWEAFYFRMHLRPGDAIKDDPFKLVGLIHKSVTDLETAISPASQSAPSRFFEQIL